MIAFAIFLFAMLVVAWLVAPSEAPQTASEPNTSPSLQPEGQHA
jgi:hypothetical protein